MAGIITILLVFFVLMLIGIPMGIALGVSGSLCIFVFQLSHQVIGDNFVNSIAKFPLLAIPFFILAGVIFERAKLAATIAVLFEKIVGRTSGGMAMVAGVTCMFWGALSGSGPATTAAVGLILIGPMVKHGYDKNFAAAVIANASDLSIIIPPSIAFIIYGTLTGSSVSALFMAGVIPGILMGIGIIITAWLISLKRNYRGEDQRGSMKDILIALRRSFWALLAPVIILGGIYKGIFTPTEAAVIAVFYSLFVAMIIYRTISFADLIPIFVDAAVMTSVVMFIVAFAGTFAYAAKTLGVIDKLANVIISISPNAIIMILLVNLLLLILGMFLDAISISYLIMPILLPVLQKFGIDPIWYGVIFITALAIGQTTPPVGVNLFTAANLIKSDIDSISKEIVPFVVVNVVVLVIISLFASLSLWLPTLTGHISP